MLNCKYTNRIAKCLICQISVETTNEQKEITDHVFICEETEVPCDSCEEKVKRKFILDHKNKDCEYQKMTCDFCKNIVLRIDLPSHLRQLCRPSFMGVIDREYGREIRDLKESFSKGIEQLNKSIQKLKLRYFWEEIKNLSVNDNLLQSKELVEEIFQIKWNKDDTSILNLSQKTIKIWNVETMECLKTFERENDSFQCVIQIKSDSDDNIIAVGTGIKYQIILYNIETGLIFKTLSKHFDAVVYLCQIKWNRDKSTLASGSKDSTIKIWNINLMHCMFTLTGHSSSVHSLIHIKSNLEGETILISRGDDKEIKVWDIEKRKCRYTLKGYKAPLSCHLLLKSDKNLVSLASGYNDGFIAIWNLLNGRCLKIFQAHYSVVHAIIQMKTNKNEFTIVSASEDKTIKLWNGETAELIKVLNVQSTVNRLIQLKFKLDDRLILSANYDGNINIWNFETREKIAALNQHNKSLNSIIQMKLKNDALCLISAGSDKKVIIWGKIKNL